MAKMRKSIVGKRLGLGDSDELVSNAIQITDPCVNATITVGDESTNVRAITIQLEDATGTAVSEPTLVKLYVFSDATLQALATGGSTGIAIGTDGTILVTHTAKLIFEIMSEADGDIDLTWTDTGTESVVLGLVLPNGRIVTTAPFANA
jgi:hypothetical protein